MTAESQPARRSRFIRIVVTVVLPIIVTVVLTFAILSATSYATIFTFRDVLHVHHGQVSQLLVLYVGHAWQLVFGLIAIGIMKFVQPADYGMHLPRGKTYIPSAILWGIFFGVLMTAVDYAPQLIAHTKPPLGFPPTPANVGGWLFFEGIYVGPTEEIPFRALLVSYLAAAMPLTLRIGRFEMKWAGVIVAFIFALLHAGNFDTREWQLALGQQFYAFALGVLYAYWLEKSKSIVAPIIGHNVGDVVEYIILFAWVGAFQF
jgi:uncharacterized protein